MAHVELPDDSCSAFLIEYIRKARSVFKRYDVPKNDIYEIRGEILAAGLLLHAAGGRRITPGKKVQRPKRQGQETTGYSMAKGAISHLARRGVNQGNVRKYIDNRIREVEEAAREGRRAKHREIVDYWTIHEDECGLGVDWAEAHERCWRCGYKSVLQECHIIPDSLGGSNDPSNLVLLCRRCHREAPNVEDRRFMWIWLRTGCVPFYDLYWNVRGIQEFEKMFGRKPFTTSEFLELPNERARKVMEKRARELQREEMCKAVIHYGEGRMNPSTIACIYALVEERITGRPVVAASRSSTAQDFLEAVGWAKPHRDSEPTGKGSGFGGRGPQGRSRRWFE